MALQAQYLSLRLIHKVKSLAQPIQLLLLQIRKLVVLAQCLPKMQAMYQLQVVH